MYNSEMLLLKFFLYIFLCLVKTKICINLYQESLLAISLKQEYTILLMMIRMFFFVFFFIQFNVTFKIISLIETSQSIGGAKREYPGKTT